MQTGVVMPGRTGQVAHNQLCAGRADAGGHPGGVLAAGVGEAMGRDYLGTEKPPMKPMPFCGPTSKMSPPGPNDVELEVASPLALVVKVSVS